MPAGKTTAPAFPLYGGDWLKSTARLSAAERGYYLDLLLYTWDNDEPVPDDEREQMQIVRCTNVREWRKAWDRIRAKWTAVDGGFRNERCELEREKLKTYRRGKSEAGKAGAESRWRGRSKTDDSTDGKADSTAMAEPLAEGIANGWPSISSSSSEGSDRKERDPIPSAPTRELLRLFDDLHRVKLGSPADINGRADGAILAQLTRQRGAAETERLIRAFFALNDPWVAQRGYTVRILKTQIGKLLALQAPPPSPARASRIDPEVRALCDAAGLKRLDIEKWFVGAALARDPHKGEVVLAITEADSRQWVIRHYSDALEAAVVSRGGARLVIRDHVEAA